MTTNLIANASVTIRAPRADVWHALITPPVIAKYMFGTEVVSGWTEGSPIVWKGEWQGRSYEDKGTILQLRPERLLQFTHFSPSLGLPDVPENHHTVTIELADAAGATRVTLTQDNNATEQARAHSEKNWETALQGLKKLLEARS